MGTNRYIKVMKDHADRLAVTHNVRIVYTAMDMRYSCANCEGREVYVPTIDSSSTYAVVMHELGHVIAPGAGRYHANMTAEAKLGTEQLAWQWARQNAICWNQDMTDTMRFGLGGYEHNADAPTLTRDQARELVVQMINKILKGGQP